jgi:hypothetical protein
MNSPSLCSLAGQYDNPIPPWFLAPIDFLKIPALAGRYDNPIPTWFLAPIDCLKFQLRGKAWVDQKANPARLFICVMTYCMVEYYNAISSQAVRHAFAAPSQYIKSPPPHPP